MHMEALGMVACGVQDFLLDIPSDQPWEASREELKRSNFFRP